VRILCCVVGLVLVPEWALAQTPSPEEAIKAELEKLRAQAQALESRLQALQAAKAKAERDAAEKYMTEFAELCLEALFKGEADAVLPVLSKEIRDHYAANKWPVDNYTYRLDPRKRGIEISAYKVTSVSIAPSFEEGIFRGQFNGKFKGGDENGKDKTGSFALRIHKEKESGRYVIGFASVYLK
jgi:hypothetical protein